MPTNPQGDAHLLSATPTTRRVGELGADLPDVPALVEEMRRRWTSGERPSAEEYLGRHPVLSQQAGAALRLISEEFRLRRGTDGEADPAEFLRRFPQWRSELEILLGANSPSALPDLEYTDPPRVDERLGDFQLLAELGRGALGCVFLARQPALADRPVVLKVTPCTGEEHLSLARLQHTHIVPLYAVQHDEAEQLLGPSHVLLRERQAHAQALDLHTLAAACSRRAEELAPRTAWEDYALGRSLMRRRPLGVTPGGASSASALALAAAANQIAADAALRRAVALEPAGLWPNFYCGLSAYRLGRYQDAVGAFSVCVGVAPRTAGVYYNRSLARAALGQDEAALDDLHHALDLDGRFAARAACVHHNLAVARLASGDRRGAIVRLVQALRADPQYLPARNLLTRLMGP
jgi:tetratricopeptide (TPR) repeat protein